MVAEAAADAVPGAEGAWLCQDFQVDGALYAVLSGTANRQKIRTGLGLGL